MAYTDGCSIGNPGPSGAGVVFFTQDIEKIEEEEVDELAPYEDLN